MAKSEEQDPAGVDDKDSLQDQVDRLRDQLEEQRAGNIALRKVDKDKETAIERLEDVNSTLRVSCDDLREELTNTTKKVNDLTSKYDTTCVNLEKAETVRENLENEISSHELKSHQLNHSLQLLLTERQSLLAENDQAHSERTELQHFFDSTLDQLNSSDRQLAALLHGTPTSDQNTLSFANLEQQIRFLEQQKVHFESMSLQLQHDQEAIVEAFALLATNANVMARTRTHNPVRVDSLYKGDERSSAIIQEVFTQLDLPLRNKKSKRRQKKKGPASLASEGGADDGSDAEEYGAVEENVGGAGAKEKGVEEQASGVDAVRPSSATEALAALPPMTSQSAQTDPPAAAEPSPAIQPDPSVTRGASMSTQTDPPTTSGPSTATQTAEIPAAAPPPTASTAIQTDMPPPPPQVLPPAKGLEDTVHLILGTLMILFFLWVFGRCYALVSGGRPASLPGSWFVKEMGIPAQILRFLGVPIELQGHSSSEFAGVEY